MTERILEMIPERIKLNFSKISEKYSELHLKTAIFNFFNIMNVCYIECNRFDE